MSNLSTLNDILFDQLKRLNSTDCTGDKLAQETDKAKSISTLAKDVVSNARLALDAAEFRQEAGLVALNSMPKMLSNDQK